MTQMTMTIKGLKMWTSRFMSDCTVVEAARSGQVQCSTVVEAARSGQVQYSRWQQEVHCKNGASDHPISAPRVSPDSAN